jgi:predicted porin
MQLKPLIRPLALALLALSGAQAHAVSFTQGDVTIDINGTVNGFYVNREMQLTDRASGNSVKTTDSQLTNGTLPGWINFVATTKANDLDIKAHISFAPGISSQSTVVGLPGNSNVQALGLTNAQAGNGPYSQVDTRNLYFSFGNASWGTLKFGRDIGLFAADVVLADMTLIGVGGTSWAGIPFNTTFANIGHGYMYTGFQPQITYTTPPMGGFKVSAGVFQPSKFAGNETKTPGFQALASYDWKGGASGKVWAGLVSQQTSCSNTSFSGNSCAAVKTFDASGQEIGVKVGAGDFEAVAYAFTAKGLGLSTVGAMFLNPGDTATGERLKSDGYFLQATYKLGATKLGINHGRNRDRDGWLANAGRSITNESTTLGVYHTLNKYITLVAEFNQEKIDNVLDMNANAKNRTLSLGGIIFF